MWNAIKGAIFTDEPGAPSPAPQGQVTVTASNIKPAVAATISPGVNAEFVAAIRKGVFAKNTALTQLITAADALEKIIPDQITRFRAAFATAGTGRTPQQIISAVDIHLADVDGEVARFKVALDQQLGAEIQQAALAAQSSDSIIANGQAELERIQQRITEVQQQMAAANQRRGEQLALKSQKEAELQHTESAFALAANAVRAELTNIKSTVSTALS